MTKPALWDPSTKQGTFLSQKSRNGQADSYQWCETPACPTCSVSSRNLDDQHTNTANVSFSIWFCLAQIIRSVGAIWETIPEASRACNDQCCYHQICMLLVVNRHAIVVWSIPSSNDLMKVCTKYTTTIKTAKIDYESRNQAIYVNVDKIWTRCAKT